jgi:uracil-DNA glycosylase
MRRFANMRWSILTPRGSIHWDGETMREGPPARREDAPGDDPIEDLWRSYYASIFNPARLKVGAMLSEMPKKYWKNLPEAALIPQLIAGAQAREAAMVKAGERKDRVRPATLAEVAQGAAACRDCPIADCGTRAVAGEGPERAALMIVGEQPGDQEDAAGRVFVGPAGQVLGEYLEAAGIDRRAAYVTNAVKHFKFTWKGKHRLHQSPAAKEIDTCRWWLEAERAIVRPRIVLALGASAARGLLGRTVSVNQVRGRGIPLDDGAELWVTVHPSYLLRLNGEARAAQAALFAADLAMVRERLAAV